MAHASLQHQHNSISQGSVATRFGCDGIFDDDFIAHFPESVPVKKNENSLLRIAKGIVRRQRIYFFRTRCINLLLFDNDRLDHTTTRKVPTSLGSPAQLKNQVLPSGEQCPWHQPPTMQQTTCRISSSDLLSFLRYRLTKNPLLIITYPPTLFAQWRNSLLILTQPAVTKEANEIVIYMLVACFPHLEPMLGSFVASTTNLSVSFLISAKCLFRNIVLIHLSTAPRILRLNVPQKQLFGVNHFVCFVSLAFYSVVLCVLMWDFQAMTNK